MGSLASILLVEQAKRFAANGADILDVGGQSTKTGFAGNFRRRRNRG